jgi:cbb3-type cytochrome oxidase subunit 3
MAPLMLLMTLFGILVFWIFFAFQPRYVNKKQLKVFNLATLGVTLLVAAAFALNINVVFADPSYDKFRKPIALCGALGIQTVMMTFFFVLRNFWIFRSTSPGRRAPF